MATLSRSTVSVEEDAGALASGTDNICVLAPVATSADLTPRIYGNVAALIAKHGYCEGAEYAALHFERTRKPVLFVGLPIDTPGEITDEDESGNTDTCDTAVTAGSSGVLAEHDGVLTVIAGGTIGADQIILGLSLDGGRTTKRIRLGTGNSYADPYYGFTIGFGAGDLTAGQTIHTWHGTAPLYDTADLATARANLAAQQKGFRSALLIGDLPSDTEAAAFLAMLEAYETSDDRFIFGRAQVYDHRYTGYAGADQTISDWIADVDAEFESVDGACRLSLGAGRGRVLSPITGWFVRRPAAWAASLREYTHDLHIATWRKSDGNTGFDLYDADGILVEYDDRTNGGAASLARFTSLRSWANGPNGAFVSQDVTRNPEGTLLSLTHNVAVTNLAQTIVQRSTENVAIGQTLILNPDGTATSDSLKSIEAPVNSALKNQLLTNLLGEGQRASGAVWTADPSTVYNVAEPIMVGTLNLLLNGTVHSVVTTIKIQRGA